MQGAGGGLLTPVGMSMLYRAFPPEERVRLSRLLMFPTILGPALGPVLGGFLVEKLSWHWAFFANVPLGLGAFTFGLLFLSEHREAGAGRFDLPPALRRALRFAPAAALAAIVAPDLLLNGGVLDLGAGNTRLVAGLAGFAVALATRSTLTAIVTGMLVLHGLERLL